MHFLQRGYVSSHLIRRALSGAARTDNNVSDRDAQLARAGGSLAPTGRLGTLCEPWAPIAFDASHPRPDDE